MSSHFSSIVLAFDGSENSYKALAEAEKLAKLSQARLKVLYVTDPTPTYNRPILSGMVVFNQPFTVTSPVLASNDDTEDLADDPSDMILSEAKLKLSTTLKNLDFEKRTGKPAEEICDYAKDHQADLIVIGSRGLSGFQKLIMGSVSSQVTHHAECPVLVVK